MCISAFNDIYYCVAFLGIVAAGGVFGGTSQVRAIDMSTYLTPYLRIESGIYST